MYTRIGVLGKVGWDDAFIAAATASLQLYSFRSPVARARSLTCSILKVLSCIGVGFNVPDVSEGLGRHGYYIGPDQTAKAIRWSTLAQAQHVLSTGLIKISVCVCLLRILISRPMARFLYGLIAVIVIMSVVTFCAVISQCQPLAKIWDPRVPGKCWHPLVIPKIGRAQGSKTLLTHSLDGVAW
jgi:hypothetical protein